MRSLTIMTEVSKLFDFMLGETGIQVGVFNVIPAVAIIAFYPQRVTQRILQYSTVKLLRQTLIRLCITCVKYYTTNIFAIKTAYTGGYC